MNKRYTSVESMVEDLADDETLAEIREAIEQRERDTESAVCRDIIERQKLGMQKYGTTVANNPLPLREWLQHAYEECLDQTVYLKRAIQQIDSPGDV